MLRKRFQITEYCHHFLEDYIQEGDICVDATAGNGNDTEFLCHKVGKSGKVYAFDIQEQAIRNTRQRLCEAGVEERAELLQIGHEHMKSHVTEEVSAIVFNFGYLPGGNHEIATRKDTSLEAVEQALALLKVGGILNLCIYSGKDTGYEEKEALLRYVRGLDSKKWLVLVHEFYNRKNDPPLPVFIIRM